MNELRHWLDALGVGPKHLVAHLGAAVGVLIGVGAAYALSNRKGEKK